MYIECVFNAASVGELVEYQLWVPMVTD